MSGPRTVGRRSTRTAIAEPRAVRWALIGLVLAFLGAFVALPIGVVFQQAFAAGARAFLAAISDGEARSAIALTLLTAAIAVPLNTVFGVAAA